MLGVMSSASRTRVRAPSSWVWVPAAGAVVAGLVLVLISRAALEPLWTKQPVFAVGAVVTGVALIAAGAVLVGHQRTVLPGRAALTVGALWPATFWGIGQAGIGPFASWVASGLLWSALCLAVVSYPSDGRRGPAASAFLALALVTLIPVNIGMTMISRPEWSGFDPDSWWPTVVAVRPLFEVLTPLYGLLDLVIGGFCAWVVFHRLKTLSGVDRAALLPAAVGVASAAMVAGVTSVTQNVLLTNQWFAAMVFVQGLGLLALPTAVALAVARTRMARADVADLVSRLAEPVPFSVRDALRTTLRDPQLEVFYRLPEREGYVNSLGQPARPPQGDAHLGIPVAGPDGAALALIVVDPRLRFHPKLVDSSVSAAGMALENARLQAELRSRLAEVHASRTRIIQAQMQERRRIERDLHDGAQQHLLALALRLEAARVATADPVTAESLVTIKAGLQRALQEIRDLAQGIHPALLSEGGLALALEPVVERLPLRVFVTLPEGRLDATAETAAYFVICEALANVRKHARANSVRVRGVHREALFLVEVSDDGVGGADPAGGTGLRGLVDRVHAIGGQVAIASTPGRGTTVRASLPCPA